MCLVLGRDPETWRSLTQADVEEARRLFPMYKAGQLDLLEVLDVWLGRRDPVEPIVQFQQGYVEEAPDAGQPDEGTNR